MLALVTRSKRIYKNTLGYDTKTKEYVYIHDHQIVWRTPSINGDLFEYFNTKRINDEFTEQSEIEQLTEDPIYQQYSNSCQAQSY